VPGSEFKRFNPNELPPLQGYSPFPIYQWLEHWLSYSVPLRGYAGGREGGGGGGGGGGAARRGGARGGGGGGGAGGGGGGGGGDATCDYRSSESRGPCVGAVRLRSVKTGTVKETRRTARPRAPRTIVLEPRSTLPMGRRPAPPNPNSSSTLP